MLKFLKEVTLCSVFLFFAFTINAQYFRENLNFQELHHKYETKEFDFNALYSRASESSDFIAELNLGGYGSFQLVMRTANLMMKNSKTTLFDGKRHIPFRNIRENQWKGEVLGSKKQVRLNIYPNCLSGMIETDSGALFIETFLVNGVSKLLIYHSKDNKPVSGDFCQVESEESNHKDPISTKRSLNYKDYTCNIVKVSNVIAYQLFKQNKYDTVSVFNLIRDVFNISDGIYGRDLKIRLKISHETISLDSTAVMNNSSSTLDRIEDLNKKRMNFYGNMQSDIVHLYSENYNTSDNAVGRGYLGGVCSKFNNTSCSQRFNLTMNYWAMVLSHEIGHNLGADHNHGVACGSNGSIMCPGNGNYNNLHFSQPEIDVMLSKINSLVNSTSISVQDFCLEYPINNSIEDFDAFGYDSVLVELVIDKDFNASKIRRQDGSYLDVTGKTQVWLKSAGEHHLISEIDTVSGLVCNLEDRFFIAKGDFVVRNGNVFGLGSLGNAIMNSNVHKGMDTIVFDLPVNQGIIMIDTFLPPLIDSCVIDGASQKGYRRANSKEKYLPTVTLLDKMPPPLLSDRYCFNLAKEKYVIKNLNFDGFYTPIHAFMESYNYKARFKKYYAGITDSNFLSEYIIQGNKFNNYISAIYLNGFIVNNSTDEILIGGDSLFEANFFMNPLYSAGRIPYSHSTTIKNNYFGVEPGVEGVGTISDGFTFNTTKNIHISRNHFGNFKGTAFGFSYSDGKIEGNTFGYNPFTKEVTYTSGSMVQISSSPFYGNLYIGDTLPGTENVFFGKGNKPVIQIAASAGVIVSNNKIVTNDSFYIVSANGAGIKPISRLEIDSVNYSCQPSKSHIVFGSVKPTQINDTMYLCFYAVPSYSLGKKACPMRFLGMKTVFCTDTLQEKFSCIVKGAGANEGIVATATSSRLKLTGENSNVVFPLNKLNSPVRIKSDTIMCPQENFTLKLDQPFVKLMIDGNEVEDGYQLSKSGYYEISAESNQGCQTNYPLVLNYYPDYLKHVSILGPDRYVKDSTAIYYIDPISYGQYWNYNQWKADSSKLILAQKYFVELNINSDKTVLKYSILDINGCKNSIERSIISKENVGVTTSVFAGGLSIYPNPVNGNQINFSQKIYGTVILYDSYGRKILEMKPDENGISGISLKDLAKGAYYLYIKDFGGTAILIE